VVVDRRHRVVVKRVLVGASKHSIHTNSSLCIKRRVVVQGHTVHASMKGIVTRLRKVGTCTTVVSYCCVVHATRGAQLQLSTSSASASNVLKRRDGIRCSRVVVWTCWVCAPKDATGCAPRGFRNRCLGFLSAQNVERRVVVACFCYGTTVKPRLTKAVVVCRRRVVVQTNRINASVVIARRA
jgi:hypothetical protein